MGFIIMLLLRDFTLRHRDNTRFAVVFFVCLQCLLCSTVCLLGYRYATILPVVSRSYVIYPVCVMASSNLDGMLAQLLCDNSVDEEISALQLLLSDLSSNCAQLEASCVSLTADVHHLCQQHHVEAAPALEPTTPPQEQQQQHAPILQVPLVDPLLVGIEAAASWQRGAASSILPLPYIFGSAEYLQDPDCGLGGLDSSCHRSTSMLQGGARVVGRNVCVCCLEPMLQMCG